VVAWNRRLGAHVEASRQRAEMTRAELAKRMRVSEETIRRWERGGSQPSEAHLVRLIAVLALDGGAMALESGGGEAELPPLARQLRQERASRRITQTEAAELLGVAQPTYAGWEVGRSSPEAGYHASISEYLGVAEHDVEHLVAVPFVVNDAAWPRLGRVLGRRRQALRLTRTELAERIGVTRSTIVNWELGYRTPRVQQLSALASTLDVTVLELKSALPVGRAKSALDGLVRERQGILGLTRAEIAKRAGTDESTLSRWVHGHRHPGVSGIRRLAAALEVPLSSVSELVAVG
jgi:transcriptional regulator with XRE-family HTH domain